MTELIKFEISKLMKKKLVLISIAGLFLFSLLMISSWATEAVRMSSAEVSYSREESLKKNREFLQTYEGKLTDEKVQAIVLSAGEKSEAGEPKTYTEEVFQKIFCDDEGNILPVAAVFPKNQDGIRIGDTMGWDYFIYALSTSVIGVGIALIIILAPLFSDEYVAGMDNLILSSRYGKTKGATAKVLSGFLISGVVALGVILLFVAGFLFFFGTGGWDSHIQLSQRMPYVRVAEPLTCLRASLEVMGASFLSVQALAGIVMLISAASRTSFTSIILSAVVYLVPVMIPGAGNPNVARALELFPVRMPTVVSVGRSLGDFEAAGHEISLILCAAVIAAVCVALAFFPGKRIFAGHQVVS